MTPDQRALLDGIIADPADDLKRLVYADWLEENGNASDRTKALVIRQDIACAYSTLYGHETTINGLTCFWLRGFICEVTGTMAQWLEHGPAICSEHPVERVVITDKETDDSPSGWTYYGIDGGGFDSMHVPVCIQKEPRPDMYFPSVESANADLSARCIAWAREQAYQLTTCDRPG